MPIEDLGTGMFLLLSIFLFLGYAVNTLVDENLNLLITTVLIACSLSKVYH